jgi:ABC-type antimicrobial peptide transport system permease subunit
VLVRTTVDPGDLTQPVKALITSVDPHVSFGEVTTMQNLVNQSIGGRGSSKLLVVVSTTFGVVSIVLALIGIFGVVSNSVSQSSHKIGVCFALGAQRSDILKLVISQSMRPVVVGLLLGYATSVLTSRWLNPFLYKVKANDPMTLGSAALFLFVCALIACTLPAYRATRMNPGEILRSQ